MSEHASSITFNSFSLSKEILQAHDDVGYETPSAIQEQCISHLLDGHDVIGQAQTGTGKTAAFSLPLIDRIDLKNNQVQLLVLAPTRELAQQIQKVVIALGDYMGAQCHACIGGTSVREDMRKLDAGQHIVVGKHYLSFLWMYRLAHIRVRPIPSSAPNIALKSLY